MKRLVGLIDIIGYKSLCEERDSEELCENISNALRMSKIFLARNNVQHDSNGILIADEQFLYCKMLSFADSILIIADNDSLISTYQVICGMARVSALLLSTYKLPNRGAIVRDDFCFIEEENIFAGKAVSRLSKMEKLIEFCGIIISEDVILFLKDMNYYEELHCLKLNDSKNKTIGRGIIAIEELQKDVRFESYSKLKRANLIDPFIVKWSDLNISESPLKVEERKEKLYFLNYATFINENICYDFINNAKRPLTENFINKLKDDLLKQVD
jgi:hypothetical protein